MRKLEFDRVPAQYFVLSTNVSLRAITNSSDPTLNGAAKKLATPTSR
mgnify:CR=1 FL=1